jgi:hypothetical protein
LQTDVARAVDTAVQDIATSDTMLRRPDLTVDPDCCADVVDTRVEPSVDGLCWCWIHVTSVDALRAQLAEIGHAGMRMP